MGERTGLQNLLESTLGSTNVYFQPPPTVEMKYPCIVYMRSDINTMFANNLPYILGKRYVVTVIDKNPDSLIPDKIAALPQCKFDRHFKVDNLNHDVFTIYY